MRRITGILLAIVLSLIVSQAGCGGGPQNTAIAAQAPDFELKSVTGDSISLSSLNGRLVIINVWATTCPPCVQEMPQFEALQKEWQNRPDVKILMIDLGESTATVNRFLSGRNYTFSVLLDPGFDMAQKYDIRYTPTTFIINKDGRLSATFVGPFKDKAAIQKAVQPYLAN